MKVILIFMLFMILLQKRLKHYISAKKKQQKIIHETLKIMLLNKKISQLFKGDCRSSFVINKKDVGAFAHKDVNTQFGFVLNTLSIKMENSSEPMFKGDIERSFRTIQSQLKQEIREKGFKTHDEVNTYLKEYRIHFNKEYGVKAIKKEKKFVDIKISKNKFNELLSIRSYWKTNKGNSISYKNTLYSLYDKNNNKLVFKEKSPILVMEKFDEKIAAKYFGEVIVMEKTQYQNLTHSQKDQYKNAVRLIANFSSPNYHP